MAENIKPVIAVLGGAGHEGSGLAMRWAKARFTVVIGSRDATRAAASARELFEKCGGSISGMSNAEAATCG